MTPSCFLSQQKGQSLESVPDTGDLPSIDAHPYFSLIVMRKSLAELKERLDESIRRELSVISDISKPAFDYFYLHQQ